MGILLCVLIVLCVVSTVIIVKQRLTMPSRSEWFLDGYIEGLKRGYEVGQKGRSIADQAEIELLFKKNGAE